MTYKLRYSRSYQVNYSERAEVEIEQEFHESIAPSDALKQLQTEMDKMRLQLFEKTEAPAKVPVTAVAMDSQFAPPIHAGGFGLWQPCNQIS